MVRFLLRTRRRARPARSGRPDRGRAPRADRASRNGRPSPAPVCNRCHRPRGRRTSGVGKGHLVGPGAARRAARLCLPSAGRTGNQAKARGSARRRRSAPPAGGAGGWSNRPSRAASLAIGRPSQSSAIRTRAAHREPASGCPRLCPRGARNRRSGQACAPTESPGKGRTRGRSRI